MDKSRLTQLMHCMDSLNLDGIGQNGTILSQQQKDDAHKACQIINIYVQSIMECLKRQSSKEAIGADDLIPALIINTDFEIIQKFVNNHYHK